MQRLLKCKLCICMTYGNEYNLLQWFKYFVTLQRERERERQLLLTVKAKHTSAPIGSAIFTRIWEDERQLQEVVNFKHACVPTGRAIFNWLCVSFRLLSYWTRHFQLNMRRRAELKMPSFLFVAPFSSDSTFITCDLNLDMRFVLILNYKHVRTAGFRVCTTSRGAKRTTRNRRSVQKSFSRMGDKDGWYDQLM